MTRKLYYIEQDPYQKPPPYEKLIGDLAGAYSRRINIQHRLVYQVLEVEKAVKVLRLFTMNKSYCSKGLINGVR